MSYAYLNLLCMLLCGDGCCSLHQSATHFPPLTVIYLCLYLTSFSLKSPYSAIASLQLPSSLPKLSSQAPGFFASTLEFTFCFSE